MEDPSWVYYSCWGLNKWGLEEFDTLVDAREFAKDRRAQGFDVRIIRGDEMTVDEE